MASGFYGFDEGDAYASALKVGTEDAAGTKFDRIRVVVVSVNPADLATITTAETAVTITGVATGDFVVAMPPALEAGLVYGGCRVSGADTVQVRLGNVTAGSINAAAANWTFLVFEAAA